MRKNLSRLLVLALLPALAGICSTRPLASCGAPLSLQALHTSEAPGSPWPVPLPNPPSVRA